MMDSLDLGSKKQQEKAAKNKEMEDIYMGMGQYLLIPFLGEWTSIYQLFWHTAIWDYVSSRNISTKNSWG